MQGEPGQRILPGGGRQCRMGASADVWRVQPN
jgi:hypothetical protein